MENFSDNIEDKDITWERLPKKTREFSSFLFLVMDAARKSMVEALTSNYLRNYNKDCSEIIKL